MGLHRSAGVWAAVLGLGACEGLPSLEEAPSTAPRLGTVERALGHCGEPLCFVAPDTLLNSTVSGAQEMPAVATAPDGATVVVFRDRSGAVADPTNGDAIRARFFDPGALFRSGRPGAG